MPQNTTPKNLKYAQKIATEPKITNRQGNSIYNLHEEGATIPFIARYRKEATGNLDEVVIGNVISQVKYFNELEKRKETVLKTIEEAGKQTPELKKRIDDCVNATELEDMYLPYKPKRKTRATVATEKGLEPLATLLFSQQNIQADTEAARFINDQVKDSSEALQGARDIMAEWIAEHEQARNIIRKLFTEEAELTSRVLTGKKEETEAEVNNAQKNGIIQVGV